MSVIAARKRSLRRLCFYTCLSVLKGGWYPSMPCRSPGGVSQHALQVSRPTPKGELEGSGQGGLQTYTWGVSSPHLEGLQAHTQGGSPGPHLGGVSRPTPGRCLQAHTRGGVSQHALRQTPPRLMASAAGGAHPTGMRSCLNIYLSISHINISFMLFMIPRKIPRNLLCESGC